MKHDEFEATFAFTPSADQWSVLTAAPRALPCPSCAGPAVKGHFAVGRGFDIEHEVTRVYCFYCLLDLNTCDSHDGTVVSWGMTMYVADDEMRRPDE